MRDKKGRFIKGQVSWNKGLKGLIPWNKGLTKETDERVNYERPTTFKKGKETWNKGKKDIYSKETKKKMGLKNKGKIMLDKVKKKISSKLKGIQRTDKYREKLREARIKYIKKVRHFTPTIGRYETQMLDVLEESLGYTILRQHKMAGYFLDGFCPALNLAIEIDEKHHLNTKQRQSDIDRDNYLKKEFDCQILRIKQP